MRSTLAIIAFLVLAAPAAAKRPATDQERAAIAAPRGVPVECVFAEISTVDSSWGTFRGMNQELEQCPLGDGFAVMRNSGAGWETVAEGSESLGACQAHGIPMAVGRDLTYGGTPICRARRTYVWCLPRDAVDRAQRSRPRRCTTLGRYDSFAEAANLAELRWRRWGRRVATARGIERGFHRPLARIPVRVRAYRRRVGCAGDYVYTRMRVTSRYGRLLVRFPRHCNG
jgi:hypothetical protein